MVLFIAAAVLPLLALLVGSTPNPSRSYSLWSRDDPQFPASPPSCGLCAQNYNDIQLCMTLVPVVANFSEVISNPGSFVDVLTCACSSTFNATFPQCVDCFQNTNQQSFLNESDPDAVLAGLTKVCAFERAVGVGNNAVDSRPLFASTLGAMVLMLASVW
ncbi:hypothetical protein C8R47DRAFT_1120432 [Mycena vitilis]|nr:hypothetical protein C8R47DRAFT_1120432 [Mycena vitilis]